MTFNPIFCKIKEYLSDEYWISFMDDLAMNKFPKGFSYRDGSLIYRKPGKIYKKKLDSDLEAAVEQILDFFHEYAAKYSPDEKASMESVETQEITWRSLKYVEKHVYINNYLSKMKNKWALTSEEFIWFANQITTNISNGSIKSNRIIMHNKSIKKIVDVTFDIKTREFYIKLTSKRSNSKSTSKKNKLHPHLKHLVKYLKKLESHKNIKRKKCPKQ